MYVYMLTYMENIRQHAWLNQGGRDRKMSGKKECATYSYMLHVSYHAFSNT